jgi:hypothetical protein
LVNQGHDVTDDLVMPWEDFTGVGAPVLGSQYKNFKPTSSETNPADRPRNPVFMFISTRPADKVTDEISLVVGYPFKAGTEATAQVGGSSFALYTQQDGAWIKNATEETKMVDTMRGGDTAIIKGVSANGFRSADTFALKGLSEALKLIRGIRPGNDSAGAPQCVQLLDRPGRREAASSAPWPDVRRARLLFRRVYIRTAFASQQRAIWPMTI